MKSLLKTLLLSLMVCTLASANGVIILDANQSRYFHLDSSTVEVAVESQISITKTTQYFTNLLATGVVKYAFPLPEQASVTQLRYRLNGLWNTAVIAGQSQDSTLPGGGASNPYLLAFLGQTPLIFPFTNAVPRDCTLAVELTYVELLPYSMGVVNYSYPADYHFIQNTQINS